MADVYAARSTRCFIQRYDGRRYRFNQGREIFKLGFLLLQLGQITFLKAVGQYCGQLIVEGSNQRLTQFIGRLPQTVRAMDFVIQYPEFSSQGAYFYAEGQDSGVPRPRR